MAVRYHRPLSGAITAGEAVEVGDDRVSWRLWAAECRSNEGPTMARLSPTAIGVAAKRLERLSMSMGKKDKRWQQKTDALHEASTVFWTRAREYHEYGFQKMGCTREDTKLMISLISSDIAVDHLEALRKEKEVVLIPVLP